MKQTDASTESREESQRSGAGEAERGQVLFNHLTDLEGGRGVGP